VGDPGDGVLVAPGQPGGGRRVRQHRGSVGRAVLVQAAKGAVLVQGELQIVVGVGRAVVARAVADLQVDDGGG
jgi:hypothetical protein